MPRKKNAEKPALPAAPDNSMTDVEEAKIVHEEMFGDFGSHPLKAEPTTSAEQAEPSSSGQPTEADSPSTASSADLGPLAIILAAGRGTRMKSSVPKVVHRLMGRPIVAHCVNAAKYLNPSKIVLVVPPADDGVIAAAESRLAEGELLTARQMEPLGTGHAALSAFEAAPDYAGTVLIMPGDMPLLSPQTLLDFLDAHKALGADLSVLTTRVANPGAYGRIIRDQSGWLEKIVEARDADEEQLAVDEINGGVYAAEAETLFAALKEIKPENAQSEYYLTDVVEIFRKKGLLAAAVEAWDPAEFQGINDRRDLALAETVMRRRINESWLLAGVTMLDPDSVYIEPSVRLAEDVTLGLGVVLTGRTKIEKGASIGHYSCLNDALVSSGTVVAPYSCRSDCRLGAEPGRTKKTGPKDL
ncbi:MAG: NTP transferase domain-containing protein [Deltaproteobacteria bacterium]|nr:NTP transferase domain-containing protein [Deltaproteobacteria bacterium]